MQACFIYTSDIRYKIEAKENPRIELSKSEITFVNNQIYKGSYIGTIKFGGRSYYTYHFKGLQKEHPKVISEILVPCRHEDSHTTILRNPSISKSIIEPAHLYYNVVNEEDLKNEIIRKSKRHCLIFSQTGEGSAIYVYYSYRDGNGYNEIKHLYYTNLTSLKVHKGFYAGIIKYGSTSSHHYYFNGILKSDKKRILELIIPCNYETLNKRAVLREVKSVDHAATPAFLFRKNSLLFYPYDAADVVVDFEDEFKQTYKTHGIIFDEPHEKLLFAYSDKTGSKEWVNLNIEYDLNWVYRDKKEVSELKAKYLYSIPLDLLMTPVWFFAIITGKGF